LAAVDAALLVQLVEPHLHGVGRRHAVGGGRAGEIRVHAEHDLGRRHAPCLLLRRRHSRHRQHTGEHCDCQPPLHGPLLSWALTRRRHRAVYMSSMTSLYLVLTNARLSFIVGVSSSSSAVRICSMSRKLLMVSTRASCRFTRSISDQMRSCTSLARHSEAKLVKGTLRSWANW